MLSGLWPAEGLLLVEDEDLGELFAGAVDARDGYGHRFAAVGEDGAARGSIGISGFAALVGDGVGIDLLYRDGVEGCVAGDRDGRAVAL